MATRRGKRGEIVWEDLTVYPNPGPVTHLWRLRTEVALTAVAVVLWLRLESLVGAAVAFVLLTVVLTLLAAIPATRELILAHGRCTLTRHQLYAAFREIRATTRNGRLPLVMWIRPTPEGERAHIFCRPGICAEDLAASTERLEAACWARAVRVIVNERHPQWVVLEFVRRELPPVITGPLLPRIPQQRTRETWGGLDRR
jgi:hypothetical protein